MNKTSVTSTMAQVGFDWANVDRIARLAITLLQEQGGAVLDVVHDLVVLAGYVSRREVFRILQQLRDTAPKIEDIIEAIRLAFEV